MVEPNSKGGYNLRKRKKKDVADDMVSGLPDEILVSILSLLPLKEAQATSILSRRWQYLWAYSTNLNFDGEKNLMRLNELKGEACELEMCRYVNWVDSVLKQHRALNIERFRVFFKLGPRICIDEWIQFAMRKGVQVLELDFSAYIRYLLIGKYRFSNKLLGISETSGLKSLCSEYIGFKCLKVFDLKSVDVDQEVLEYFISNCPVLERLVVYGSSSLVNLRVVGHSIALKYLVIRRCENIKTIQICDANLVSFCYDGYVRNLVLSNLPLLVEVSIVGWLPHDFLEITFFHLSCCLSQLEILNLNYMKACCERDPIIPSLPNLKRLELAIYETENFALLHLASFIKKAPCMHTLVLRLSQSWSKKSPFAKKTAAKCSHDRLKVVEIVGYSGLSRQIELVMYLTKTASNLEKIVFDSVNSWRPRFDRLRDLVVEKEELSRAQALQLKRKLPATLEVVCL
ncbi:putative F-box domain, FBD domain, leucine-rich repeat domain, L domain-containing protein [Rosa chinensis]|uniref:Putative F-box domain, FBD domain, leucine-rich repeat domain, L domain-containing protein n=1 Tax=Rosa chinensis TaxID=74649 RepID=A0A2P6RND3_ROSCH|nr:putative F-box/LRR-repeat protein At3g42770 isoform X1 [Rosa chinensis]PRQ47942.1 putative F-box domain, FBD domain, leucine-rich repeat domain, L domain-containing protein [Rosa chinensis]